MDRILTWTVDVRQEGLTLEEFLRTRGCSHHVLTHLKHTECGILLNGTFAFANQKLKSGDEVRIYLTEEPSRNIKPVYLPLHIVYEDEDLMVVDKSADTPIHPSINNHENTLANAVMYYFTSKNIPFVFRCINRLDRDTSGLLIIAKNMYSGTILSRMSANREIHREYLAVVQGKLPRAGRIDAPIARQEDSALMRCVNTRTGDPAVTYYNCIGTFQKVPLSSSCHVQTSMIGTTDVPFSDDGNEIFSLASIHLETGRTHQIRVHMKYIGHPLIGDFLYNPSAMSLIQRQALHSHKLEFCHPITGQKLSFSCSLPDDMQRILDNCSWKSDKDKI